MTGIRWVKCLTNQMWNQWERFVLGLGSIIETVIKLVCTSRQCKLQMTETSIMHSKMHLLFIIIYDFVTDIYYQQTKR